MPLFGGGKQEKPDHKFDAEYMGGHKLYPKKRDTEIWVYPDRIFLKKLELDIPFKSMKNIENSDVERLTKTRMLLTPFFIGFFWKKRYLYTVIDYNDGISDQSIVLDLHRGVEKVQQILYKRMILSRRSGGELAYGGDKEKEQDNSDSDSKDEDNDSSGAPFV